MRRWLIRVVFPMIFIFGHVAWAPPEEVVPVSGQTSVAFFSPDRELSPRIQIRGTRVTVRHRSTGSGEVQGTALRGARIYTFKTPGTYTVEAGTYRHLVFGKVPSGGSIESILNYE